MAKDFVSDAVAATGAGTPRKAMGNAALGFTNASGADTGREILQPRGVAKGGQAPPATAGGRSGVMQERLGARYVIQAKLPGPQLPEAGQTQANGRIIPNVYGKDRANFRGGRGD